MDRFEKSRQMHEHSRQSLAGGVHSSMRAKLDPVLFFDRAEGAYIFDVDGNRYIDYKMGAGPLILGHTPSDVTDAVKDILDRGLQTATETPLGAQVAAHFVELVPGADLVRFANTGSEANHLALRVARAYRGRRRIVCFEGHFHGWFDDIWSRGMEHGVVMPATEGQSTVVEDLIILPWNDADVLAKAVADHADEIAGVIMNPVMLAGSPGGVMPLPGYLEKVRRICSEQEIVLIFDEILTGFRIALGGAQELFGVQPDVATYAKAIAAGFPLSAVAGKQPFMEEIASNRVSHPGTYNGNILCMAAAKATLERLSADDGAFYRTCNARRTQLAEGIRDSAVRHGIPVHIVGAGAVLTVWFTDRPDYHDQRTALAVHHREISARFFRGLTSHGVLSNPSMFLTDVHTEDDVAATIETADRVLKDL